MAAYSQQPMTPSDTEWTHDAQHRIKPAESPPSSLKSRLRD